MATRQLAWFRSVIYWWYHQSILRRATIATHGRYGRIVDRIEPNAVVRAPPNARVDVALRRSWRDEPMVTTASALALIVGTLAVFAGVGIWSSRGRVDSAESLIAARDSTTEPRLTATLVASVMGVWILLSAPEAGAVFGVTAAVGYAVGEALPMLAFSKVGPRVRTVMPEGHSLTEYAYARYGRTMYAYVLCVSALYMLVFLSAELTGIALAFSFIADVPQWQTATLVGGAVLGYAGYGGLRASIVTDTIQAALVLPLLIAVGVATVAVLGGPAAVYAGVERASPALLDPTAADGLAFGVALSLAIFGAELVNQTWWQRVYAGADGGTVERSFRNATLLNGAIVFFAALLGVAAAGTTSVENPAVAVFALVSTSFPTPAVVGVGLLALLLVTSSADSLCTALSSLVTVDVPRLLDDPSDETLTLGARVVTVAVMVVAVYISQDAQSVLALFLFADLLGVAVAFPLVYGLFSPRLTGTGALASSVVSLAVGTAFFPFPLGIDTWLRSLPMVGPVLPAADALYLSAFAGAAGVSVTLTLVFATLPSERYDFDRLSRAVNRLE